MSDEIRYERGELAISLDERGAWLEGEGPEACVGPLDADGLRWFVVTAGSAALHAMLAGEGDAGRGGGPRPAEAEATEAADEPEALTLDVGDAAALDPYGVRWEGDGSFTPTCPACSWAGKPRATHSEAESAVRAHRKTQRHESKTRVGDAA